VKHNQHLNDALLTLHCYITQN